jgi:hypothetical protein
MKKMNQITSSLPDALKRIIENGINVSNMGLVLMGMGIFLFRSRIVKVALVPIRVQNASFRRWRKLALIFNAD